MKIYITGDFFVSKKFYKTNLIDNSIINIFNKADYRIINLEAPITENCPKNKINKTGPHLYMSEEVVAPLLKQLKVNAVSLANNHILDYGTIGLRDTFNSLKKLNIRYVGTGSNLSEAAKPLTIEKKGLKIAILNFCENEWSIAEKYKPGANPLDLIDNVAQIKAYKMTHDKVICIIHGGHEYYHLPSPRMRKQYRFYAEQGADLIVGHHSHCIGGYEIFNNVPIFYSLGNFLFTIQSNYKSWYEGVVLEIDINNNRLLTELHPIKQDEKTFRLSFLRNNELKEYHNKIRSYNSIIEDDLKLNNAWNKFIESKYRSYLNLWSPLNNISNQYIKKLFFKTGINFISKTGMYLINNLIRCEAHSDLSKEVIKRYLKL